MLTDKAIQRLLPRDGVYRVSDGLRNGLSIEISPGGGKRWRFRYTFGGKAKMISLGVYPHVSLKDARERARLALSEIAAGRNPEGKRRKGKEGETFREIALSWLERERLEGKAGKIALRRLEMYAFPQIGDMPIAEIDAATALSVLRGVEAHGVLHTVQKVKSHISRVFKYAIACGLVHTDPTRDLSPALKKPKVHHVAAITDPAGARALYAAIRAYPAHVMRIALTLAVLTFVRPGELRCAEWGEFDLDAAEWRIPPEKMKMRRPHIVPLSRQAVDAVRGLQGIAVESPYLFPSTRDRKKPICAMATNRALRAMGYSRDEVTGHGFRAMAASILAERGWAVDAIERQLAHVEGNRVKAAYHRADRLDERRRMMQDWADFLEG